MNDKDGHRTHSQHIGLLSSPALSVSDSRWQNDELDAERQPLMIQMMWARHNSLSISRNARHVKHKAYVCSVKLNVHTSHLDWTNMKHIPGMYALKFNIV